MISKKLLFALVLGIVSFPLLMAFLSFAAPAVLGAVSDSSAVASEKIVTAFAILSLSFAAISLCAGCAHSYAVRKDERSGFSDNVFQSFIYAISYEFSFTIVSIAFPMAGTGLGWLIASLILLPFNMLLFLSGKYVFGAFYRVKKSIRR
jgi:hypothetical protein